MNWAFSIFLGGSFLQLFSWNNRWWTAGRFLAHLFFTRALGLQNDRSHQIPKLSLCSMSEVSAKSSHWLCWWKPKVECFFLGQCNFIFEPKSPKDLDGNSTCDPKFTQVHELDFWQHSLGSNWARGEECNSQPCHSDQSCPFGKNRGAGLVYHLSSFTCC